MILLIPLHLYLADYGLEITSRSNAGSVSVKQTVMDERNRASQQLEMFEYIMVHRN